MQRFISDDPEGLKQGPNPYAYVDGSPTTDVDPTGLGGCTVLYPDYPIEYANGQTSTLLGGHGGVLSYDNKSGSTSYYEYGRYNPESVGIVGEGLPSSDGNIRRVPVPDIKFDKNGNPTTASMDALRRALSNKAGKGTAAQLSCDANADGDKISEYMKNLAANANRPKYSWTPWNANHCRSVARDAFNAGKK